MSLIEDQVGVRTSPYYGRASHFERVVLVVLREDRSLIHVHNVLGQNAYTLAVNLVLASSTADSKTPRVTRDLFRSEGVAVPHGKTRSEQPASALAGKQMAGARSC
jgi:hypothetical protein